MANRLYNKQVSPKGYKRGGGVSESSKKQELASRPKRKATTKKVLKAVGKIVLPGAAAADAGVKLAKRLGRKMGGSLKPVDPKTQKGLSKLPTEVRNKMGYMKDGGKVKKKKPLSRFKKPKPGSYDYTLLNRPKHSPAPIKPKPKR